MIGKKPLSKNGRMVLIVLACMVVVAAAILLWFYLLYLANPYRNIQPGEGDLYDHYKNTPNVNRGFTPCGTSSANPCKVLN